MGLEPVLYVFVLDLRGRLRHPYAAVVPEFDYWLQRHRGLEDDRIEVQQLDIGRLRGLETLLRDRLFRNVGDHEVQGLADQALFAEKALHYRAGSLAFAEPGYRDAVDDATIAPIKVWRQIVFLKFDVEDSLQVHNLFLSDLQMGLPGRAETCLRL